jgi:hypothetical protein
VKFFMINKAFFSVAALTLALVILLPTVAAVCVPPCCSCCAPGFTPGFWKHNIEVFLGDTNGAYSAFSGGPRDGDKLTDAMMQAFLDAINAQSGMSLTFEEALENLNLRGWSADRTNTANWFNWAAGYGPYV